MRTPPTYSLAVNPDHSAVGLPNSGTDCFLLATLQLLGAAYAHAPWLHDVVACCSPAGPILASILDDMTRGSNEGLVSNEALMSHRISSLRRAVQIDIELGRQGDVVDAVQDLCGSLPLLCGHPVNGHDNYNSAISLLTASFPDSLASREPRSRASSRDSSAALPAGR